MKQTNVRFTVCQGGEKIWVICAYEDAESTWRKFNSLEDAGLRILEALLNLQEMQSPVEECPAPVANPTYFYSKQAPITAE